MSAAYSFSTGLIHNVSRAPMQVSDTATCSAKFPARDGKVWYVSQDRG